MLGKRRLNPWQREMSKRLRRTNTISWKRLSRKTRAAALLRTGGYASRELKFHDEGYTQTLTNDLSSVTALAEHATNNQLCGIAQGSAENQRIARCAYIKSAYIKGHINLPSAAAAENNGYASLWLVLDTQSNAAQMKADDFLVNYGTAYSADALQNLQYSDRFKLLKYKRIRFPPRNCFGNASTSSVGAQDIPFEIYWKGHIKKEHTGTTANVSDVTNNSIHLIAIRSEDAHASTTITYQARVRYTD